MQPHVLRLVVFIGLCVVFGTAAWGIEIAGFNQNLYPAQTLAAFSTGVSQSLPQEGKEGAGVQDEDKCTVEKEEGGKKIKYGKLCRPEYSSGNFDPACSPYRGSKAGVCEVIWCTADGKRCFRASQTAEPSKRDLPKTEKDLQALQKELGGTKIMGLNDSNLLPSTNLPDGSRLADALQSDTAVFDAGIKQGFEIGAESQGKSLDQIMKEQGISNYEEFREKAARASGYDSYQAFREKMLGYSQSAEGQKTAEWSQNLIEKSAFVPDSRARSLLAKTGAGAGTVANTGAGTGVGTGRTDAGRAIGGIAQGSNQAGPLGSSNQSGGSRGGTSPPGQTFRPSPILGNIANWAFGNSGPSTGSGQAGGGASGGTVAYAPQGDPGFYNRNFESADSQITFPDANPTPDKILAYLAQNSKRQTGEKVTAEELTERGVVDAVVLQAINNVVTPVGDFVRAFFAGGEAEKSAGKDIAEAAKENKSPLERGRLVLTLAPDDSLVPGDPTTIANLVEWESRESIPESNQAWVESSPRAGEKIEGLASAPPTYGWGTPVEEGAETVSDTEVDTAPELSDTPFEPFFPRFGFEPQDETPAAEKPTRSLFLAMGKSFGTIGEAVGSLFSTLGKSLFPWL